MILAGTGHRPDKLGGNSSKAFYRLCQFAHQELQQQKPDEVITGMALGWDMALADACRDLSIPFTVAVPFNGQELHWSKIDQKLYWNLLAYAVKIVYTDENKRKPSPPGYAVWKFQKRNEWMVDHCNRVIALWDGTSGGTANCVNYAKKIHKPVINVWRSWESFQ